MKLIIHMGYPKTATTTLQNNFFEKLNPNDPLVNSNITNSIVYHHSNF